MNDLPAIRTLGHRLDAIIIFTRRPRRWWERLFLLKGLPVEDMGRQPTDLERRARFARAKVFYPYSPNPVTNDMREAIGHQFREAWKSAWRSKTPPPQFRTITVCGHRSLQLVSSR